MQILVGILCIKTQKSVDERDTSVVDGLQRQRYLQNADPRALM
jgi:hypothetical protein